MRTFNIVVERDPDTGLYVGSVPGWPGAHSQGETLDELEKNLHEVVEMLLQDGDPKLESEFVGIRTIRVRASPDGAQDHQHDSSVCPSAARSSEERG